MKKESTVALLFGGESNEYEISLRSAYAIYRHLPSSYHTVLIGITRQGDWFLYSGDPAKIEKDTWHTDSEHLSPLNISLSTDAGFITKDGQKITPDVIFPAVHGQNCEDGRLQGLLDLIGIPYVGCGSAASCIGMDKATSKLIALQNGIPIVDFLLFTRDDLKNDDGITDALRTIEKKFASYPVFVKAVNSGSSVGAFRADDRPSLIQALIDAAAVDFKILVETFIRGKEIETAVLARGNRTTVFTPGEVESCAEFYDYDTKYKNSTARYYIPARVSSKQLTLIKDYAARVFRALGCRHLSRVDFFVTDDGNIYFNEINTMPGFTSISMYPKMAASDGISFEELLNVLIEEALLS